MTSPSRRYRLALVAKARRTMSRTSVIKWWRPGLSSDRKSVLAMKTCSGSALVCRSACAGRFVEAADCFEQALAIYRDHPQSLLGLAIAERAGGASVKSEDSLAAVERALIRLDRARPVEAALVKSQLLTARGSFEEGITTLRDVLSTAPPGFAGWTIPIEPVFRQLQGKQEFTDVLQLLARRAR